MRQDGGLDGKTEIHLSFSWTDGQVTTCYETGGQGKEIPSLPPSLLTHPLGTAILHTFPLVPRTTAHVDACVLVCIYH